MSFEADQRRNGDLAVLDMRGDVDGQADEALNAAYEAAIASDPRQVLLNFASVSYINSTGIALIVGLLAEARRSDRSILATGLTDHYKEIFEITRISDFMTFIENEPEEAADGQQP
jgi:anti-sigma B factor antagonist